MAALGPLRKVIVDDTDPSIRYNGADWFATDPRTLNNGNFGNIFNDTSHATTSSNTEFTFTFNGTSIVVQGNINMVITDRTTNATDPSWQCFVDGKLIPNNTFTSPESNWPLCSVETLAPEEHLLTVQVQSQTKPFFLDSLVYTPVPDALFPSAVLIYPDGDPALNYSTGQWKEEGEQVTQIPGASVTLSFHGTGATLIGHTSNSFPPNASSGSYFIDGIGPTPFTLPGLSSATSSTNFNTLFFTTPPLSDDFHNVTVVYDGDSEHTPLAVKIWYVTNTTVTNNLVQVPASGSSSASVGASTPSSAPHNGGTPSPSRGTDTGPIVGGIIGGIFLVGVIFAVLYVLRRRRAAAQDREATAFPGPTMEIRMAFPPPMAMDGSGVAAYPRPYPGAAIGASTSPTATTVSPLASWVSWGASAGSSSISRADPNTAPYGHGELRDTVTSRTLPPTSANTDSWGTLWHGQPPSQMYGVQSQRGGRWPSSTGKSAPPSSSGGPTVVQHEDSGARSVGESQNPFGAVYEVVEVPPGYTPT